MAAAGRLVSGRLVSGRAGARRFVSFDAMVLAAGYGRRLRPLTDDLPKALIRVGGLTQLERTLRALEAAGAGRIVVNTHHHAEQIERFLDERAAGADSAPSSRRARAQIMISREDPRPLETGGGLLAARDAFHGDRPIVVHNVDVITTIDLVALTREHEAYDRLATLAVQERAASRYLLFDAAGLQGRLDVRSGVREDARPCRGTPRRLAFTGVHVMSPGAFDRMTEEGPFSIIDFYLRLAADGRTAAAIRDFDVGEAEWWDVGTPERLAAARDWFGG